MDLTDKVALVTGSTGGIGAAIARSLAAAGAAVVVVGRRAEEGAAVAGDLPRATFVAADITRGDQREHVLATARDRFGRLDILVNNAAAMARDPADEDDFDRVFALNVKAAYFLTLAALPALTGSGAGRVVNVSSIGTIKTFPGAALYNATKAALDNLTRSWAQEHGPHGVRVNSVNPGLVADGPMSAPKLTTLDVDRYVLPTIPARRLATAADVASVVTFLAGPGADYLNGVIVPLDGGLTA